MATRDQLCAIVARNLPIRSFVSDDSAAIRKATDILVGVSEELVAESAKARAGLKEIPEARADFEAKYFAALRETRTWMNKSDPRTESYWVAEALLEHLQTTGDRYGIQRTYSNRM
jgi:hypothetical protein